MAPTIASAASATIAIVAAILSATAELPKEKQRRLIRLALLAVGQWALDCKTETPTWQELRAELHDDGLEVVTVALDAAGPEAARPWVERARPQHPALIDEHHRLGELFGIVNVPSGVWIDEAGVIGYGGCDDPPDPPIGS